MFYSTEERYFNHNLQGRLKPIPFWTLLFLAYLTIANVQVVCYQQLTNYFQVEATQSER